MTGGQIFPLFCDVLGFSHVEAHFWCRIDDKILEAALTLAQPKKTCLYSCFKIFLLFFLGLSTQVTNLFSNVNYVQLPVAEKRTWGCMFKNCIHLRGLYIVKCVENRSLTVIPLRFTKKLMRVKNVLNVTCALIRVLARGKIFFLTFFCQPLSRLSINHIL